MAGHSASTTRRGWAELAMPRESSFRSAAATASTTGTAGLSTGPRSTPTRPSSRRSSRSASSSGSTSIPTGATASCTTGCSTRRSARTPSIRRSANGADNWPSPAAPGTSGACGPRCATRGRPTSTGPARPSTPARSTRRTSSGTTSGGPAAPIVGCGSACPTPRGLAPTRAAAWATCCWAAASWPPSASRGRSIRTCSTCTPAPGSARWPRTSRAGTWPLACNSLSAARPAAPPWPARTGCR